MSQLRIGDAERDQATSALAEHYAAGRLTKQEYDERADVAWSARFEHELRPLFADLPGLAGATRHGRISRSDRRRWPLSPALTWAALPLVWIALVGMAAATLVVLLGMPWLLFGLFWIFAINGCCGRQRRHHGWSHRTAHTR